jgi:hypothetical protein
MKDMMTTYHCANAQPERQWLGRVDIKGIGSRAIAFLGSTEEEVKAKMREFYTGEKASHQNRTPVEP